MDKVIRRIHKPQPFWRERRVEAVSNQGPSAYQPNALPLGQTGSRTGGDDDDDVGFHVLWCRVDILGTNCKKVLKVKMSGGAGGEGRESRFSFSTCNHVRGAARRLLLDKKDILSLGVHFTADKKRRPHAHSCKWACNEGSIHYFIILIHPAFVRRKKP